MKKKKVLDIKTSCKRTKRKTNNKKKNKGFTLIELLAVIIILGVLMIIAIPSVTKYISSSRDSAYISTAREIVSGGMNLVNTGKLESFDRDITYYIPYSCISTENGATSPYGEWKDAYVVFTYDGTGYDYYWTSIDKANHGVYLTSANLLDSDKIIRDANEINTEIAIAGHNKVSILDKETCKNFSEPINSIYQLPVDSSLTPAQYDDANKYVSFYINDKRYSVLNNTTWIKLRSSQDIGDHKATVINGVYHNYSYIPNKQNVKFCIDATSSNNGVAGRVYKQRYGITGSITGGSWFGHCIDIINDELGVSSYPALYYKKKFTDGEFKGLVYTCVEYILDSSNNKLSNSSKPAANARYHTNHECDDFTLIDINFSS